MRNGVPRIDALQRALDLLDAIVADGGQQSVSALARATGTPISTAHRQVATLVEAGYILPLGQGRHGAGPALMNMLHRLDHRQLIANVAAPALHELAVRLKCVVQLGTFENDMVTYRIKTGRGGNRLFTRVGMQLEAYCSGIGKALLAHLPEAALRDYLAGGPFVALTSRTITDPAALAEELARVRACGYAVDDGEIAEGLGCVAVPLRDPTGQVVAAISASRAMAASEHVAVAPVLEPLQSAVERIERLAFPAAGAHR